LESKYRADTTRTALDVDWTWNTFTSQQGSKQYGTSLEREAYIAQSKENREYLRERNRYLQMGDAVLQERSHS
jgi:hypothetical protein